MSTCTVCELHAESTFRGRHVPGQDPHRRRFAGAVRAKEAEDLSPLHPEADVVHGRNSAVALGEMLHLDHSGSK